MSDSVATDANLSDDDNSPFGVHYNEFDANLNWGQTAELLERVAQHASVFAAEVYSYHCSGRLPQSSAPSCERDLSWLCGDTAPMLDCAVRRREFRSMEVYLRYFVLLGRPLAWTEDLQTLQQAWRRSVVVWTLPQEPPTKDAAESRLALDLLEKSLALVAAAFRELAITSSVSPAAARLAEDLLNVRFLDLLGVRPDSAHDKTPPWDLREDGMLPPAGVHTALLDFVRFLGDLEFDDAVDATRGAVLRSGILPAFVRAAESCSSRDRALFRHMMLPPLEGLAWLQLQSIGRREECDAFRNEMRETIAAVLQSSDLSSSASGTTSRESSSPSPSAGTATSPTASTPTTTAPGVTDTAMLWTWNVTRTLYLPASMALGRRQAWRRFSAMQMDLCAASLASHDLRIRIRGAQLLEILVRNSIEMEATMESARVECDDGESQAIEDDNGRETNSHNVENERASTERIPTQVKQQLLFRFPPWTRSLLAQRAIAAGVVNELVGDRLHVEVLQRCSRFGHLLVSTHHWQPRWTRQLWQVALRSHDSVSSVVLEFVGELIASELDANPDPGDDSIVRGLLGEWEANMLLASRGSGGGADAASSSSSSIGRESPAPSAAASSTSTSLTGTGGDIPKPMLTLFRQLVGYVTGDPGRFSALYAELTSLAVRLMLHLSRRSDPSRTLHEDPSGVRRMREDDARSSAARPAASGRRQAAQRQMMLDQPIPTEDGDATFTHDSSGAVCSSSSSTMTSTAGLAGYLLPQDSAWWGIGSHTTSRIDPPAIADVFSRGGLESSLSKSAYQLLPFAKQLLLPQRFPKDAELRRVLLAFVANIQRTTLRLLEDSLQDAQLAVPSMALLSSLDWSRDAVEPEGNSNGDQEATPTPVTTNLLDVLVDDIAQWRQSSERQTVANSSSSGFDTAAWRTAMTFLRPVTMLERCSAMLKVAMTLNGWKRRHRENLMWLAKALRQHVHHPDAENVLDVAMTCLAWGVTVDSDTHAPFLESSMPRYMTTQIFCAYDDEYIRDQWVAPGVLIQQAMRSHFLAKSPEDFTYARVWSLLAMLLSVHCDYRRENVQELQKAAGTSCFRSQPGAQRLMVQWPFFPELRFVVSIALQAKTEAASMAANCFLSRLVRESTYPMHNVVCQHMLECSLSEMRWSWPLAALPASVLASAPTQNPSSEKEDEDDDGRSHRQSSVRKTTRFLRLLVWLLHANRQTMFVSWKRTVANISRWNDATKADRRDFLAKALRVSCRTHAHFLEHTQWPANVRLRGQDDTEVEYDCEVGSHDTIRALRWIVSQREHRPLEPNGREDGATVSLFGTFVQPLFPTRVRGPWPLDDNVPLAFLANMGLIRSEDTDSLQVLADVPNSQRTPSDDQPSPAKRARVDPAVGRTEEEDVDDAVPPDRMALSESGGMELWSGQVAVMPPEDWVPTFPLTWEATESPGLGQRESDVASDASVMNDPISHPPFEWLLVESSDALQALLSWVDPSPDASDAVQAMSNLAWYVVRRQLPYAPLVAELLDDPSTVAWDRLVSGTSGERVERGRPGMRDQSWGTNMFYHSGPRARAFLLEHVAVMLHPPTDMPRWPSSKTPREWREAFVASGAPARLLQGLEAPRRKSHVLHPVPLAIVRIMDALLVPPTPILGAHQPQSEEQQVLQTAGCLSHEEELRLGRWLWAAVVQLLRAGDVEDGARTTTDSSPGGGSRPRKRRREGGADESSTGRESLGSLMTDCTSLCQTRERRDRALFVSMGTEMLTRMASRLEGDVLRASEIHTIVRAIAEPVHAEQASGDSPTSPSVARGGDGTGIAWERLELKEFSGSSETRGQWDFDAARQQVANALEAFLPRVPSLAAEATGVAEESLRQWLHDLELLRGDCIPVRQVPKLSPSYFRLLGALLRTGVDPSRVWAFRGLLLRGAMNLVRLVDSNPLAGPAVPDDASSVEASLVVLPTFALPGELSESLAALLQPLVEAWSTPATAGGSIDVQGSEAAAWILHRALLTPMQFGAGVEPARLRFLALLESLLQRLQEEYPASLPHTLQSIFDSLHVWTQRLPGIEAGKFQSALYATAIGKGMEAVESWERRFPVGARGPQGRFSGARGMEFMSSEQHVAMSSLEGGYGARRPSQYTGLVNMGCVCYMNSLLQQFFMIPRLRHAVFRAPVVPTLGEKRHGQQLVNLRWQFQTLFAHLCSANLIAYDPIPFVNACDDNPRGWFPLDSSVFDQNDTHEFFNLLMDRFGTAFPDSAPTLSDFVAREVRHEVATCGVSPGEGEHNGDGAGESKEENDTGATPQSHDLFSSLFQGSFVNQLIGKEEDYPFVIERTEPFLCVSVTVKGHDTLTGSLESLIAGDLLEGDNAYFHEDYDRKVDTLKRTVFGSLPPVLAIHLKRFELNFETMMKEKLNDRLAFDLVLDLWPYTVEGIAEREGSPHLDNQASGDVPTVHAARTPLQREDCLFRLHGVLVHSGSASSGHYYSFIRERPDDALARQEDLPAGSSVVDPTSSCSGNWYKFDDQSVTPFSVDQLEAACFGGVRVSGGTVRRTLQNRANAFMLFFDRMEPHEATAYLSEGAGSEANGSTPPPQQPPHQGEPVEPPAKRQNTGSGVQAGTRPLEERHTLPVRVPADVAASVAHTNAQVASQAALHSVVPYRVLEKTVRTACSRESSTNTGGNEEAQEDTADSVLSPVMARMVGGLVDAWMVERLQQSKKEEAAALWKLTQRFFQRQVPDTTSWMADVTKMVHQCLRGGSTDAVVSLPRSAQLHLIMSFFALLVDDRLGQFLDTIWNAITSWRAQSDVILPRQLVCELIEACELFIPGALLVDASKWSNMVQADRWGQQSRLVSSRNPPPPPPPPPPPGTPQPLEDPEVVHVPADGGEKENVSSEKQWTSPEQAKESKPATEITDLDDAAVHDTPAIDPKASSRDDAVSDAERWLALDQPSSHRAAFALQRFTGAMLDRVRLSEGAAASRALVLLSSHAVTEVGTRRALLHRNAGALFLDWFWTETRFLTDPYRRLFDLQPPSRRVSTETFRALVAADAGCRVRESVVQPIPVDDLMRSGSLLLRGARVRDVSGPLTVPLDEARLFPLPSQTESEASDASHHPWAPWGLASLLGSRFAMGTLTSSIVGALREIRQTHAFLEGIELVIARLEEERARREMSVRSAPPSSSSSDQPASSPSATSARLDQARSGAEVASGEASSASTIWVPDAAAVADAQTRARRLSRSDDRAAYADAIAHWKRLLCLRKSHSHVMSKCDTVIGNLGRRKGLVEQTLEELWGDLQERWQIWCTAVDARRMEVEEAEGQCNAPDQQQEGMELESEGGQEKSHSSQPDGDAEFAHKVAHKVAVLDDGAGDLRQARVCSNDERPPSSFMLPEEYAACAHTHAVSTMVTVGPFPHIWLCAGPLNSDQSAVLLEHCMWSNPMASGRLMQEVVRHLSSSWEDSRTWVHDVLGPLVRGTLQLQDGLQGWRLACFLGDVPVSPWPHAFGMNPTVDAVVATLDDESSVNTVPGVSSWSLTAALDAQLRPRMTQLEAAAGEASGSEGDEPWRAVGTLLKAFAMDAQANDVPSAASTSQPPNGDVVDLRDDEEQLASSDLQQSEQQGNGEDSPPGDAIGDGDPLAEQLRQTMRQDLRPLTQAERDAAARHTTVQRQAMGWSTGEENHVNKAPTLLSAIQEHLQAAETLSTVQVQSEEDRRDSRLRGELLFQLLSFVDHLKDLPEIAWWAQSNVAVLAKALRCMERLGTYKTPVIAEEMERLNWVASLVRIPHKRSTVYDVVHKLGGEAMVNMWAAEHWDRARQQADCEIRNVLAGYRPDPADSGLSSPTPFVTTSAVQERDPGDESTAPLDTEEQREDKEQGK